MVIENRVEQIIQRLLKIVSDLDQTKIRTVNKWDAHKYGMSKYYANRIILEDNNHSTVKTHVLLALARQIDKDIEDGLFAGNDILKQSLSALHQALNVDDIIAIRHGLLEFGESFLEVKGPDFQQLEGCYLAFRRVPSYEGQKKEVYVSPLLISDYKANPDYAYWFNPHRISQVETDRITYRGFIASRSSFFLLVGSKANGQSINMLSIRKLEADHDPGYRHAIGCVDGPEGPLFCPVFLKKISQPKKLTDLDEFCGVKGIDFCMRNGLLNEEYLEFDGSFYPRRYV